jgi:hypothetical protein
MDTLIARLGLALSIGLLVGLERGWQEREAPEGSRTAGMRTFGISGLLGGVLAALAQTLNSPIVFAIGFLGFAVTLGVFKLREARSDSDYSVTTVMAGLGVLALGGLAVIGDAQAAAAGGAALAATLASRNVPAWLPEAPDLDGTALCVDACRHDGRGPADPARRGHRPMGRA